LVYKPVGKGSFGIHRQKWDDDKKLIFEKKDGRGVD
jgi:hypothetical protein